MRALKLTALCLALFAPLAMGQTVTSLNFDPEDLSADGRVVVGTDVSSVVYWTAATGRVNLGRPAGFIFAKAIATNGDGTVIAGYAQNSGGPMKSFVWTAEHGFTMIDVPGSNAGQPSCVSRDGRVVAGAATMSTGMYHGFVWTREEGGRIPPMGGNYTTWIRALSPDGNIAVGSGASSQGTWAMIWPSIHLWCANLGMVEGYRSAFSKDMTPDGGVVVGHAFNGYQQSKAMIWTTGEGFTLVNSLAGFNMTELNAVSDDGRLAGGQSIVQNGGPYQGVIWRRGAGLIPASEYLRVRGLPSLAISNIEAISADGRVMIADPGSSNTGNSGYVINLGPCGSADFNHDGDVGTDQDIEAYFACLAGNCCPLCDSADFNYDGDTGTDQDIEAFFRVLAGNPC
jgi:uncharacterized membrane protein